MKLDGYGKWTGVPVELLCVSLAGTALVMGLLLIPGNDFRAVEEAGRGWVTEDGAGELHRSLPVRARPSRESDEAISDLAVIDLEVEAENERVKALRARVAANILLRSGFVWDAEEVHDESPQKAIRYKMQARGASWACTELSLPTQPEPKVITSTDENVQGDSREASVPPVTLPAPISPSPPVSQLAPVPAPVPPAVEPAEDARIRRRAGMAGQLALAAVAVEKIFRNSAHRWLELRIGALSLAVLGRLPDFSYGVAQLRPSTIRTLPADILGEPLASSRNDDHALLGIPRNECQSLKLASAVFFSILSERAAATSDESTQANLEAAARYGGKKPNGSGTKVIDYPQIVNAAVEILNSNQVSQRW